MISSVNLVDADVWAPIVWEPVTNSGERITVGALVRLRGVVSAHRILRDDLLDCLFGKRATNARQLIEFAIDDIAAAAAGGIEHVAGSVSGFSIGKFHATEPRTLAEALKAAALMYSGFASIDRFDELDETDAPQPPTDDANRRFTTEVRERVIAERPELHQYFGRSAVLIDGGEPVKFGFCSTKSLLHFGVLHPVRQPAGVLAARARLWELYRAQEIARLSFAGLIFATPRSDDPTMSKSQLSGLQRNLHELEREADSYKMRFVPVTSAADGAAKVLEYA